MQLSAIYSDRRALQLICQPIDRHLIAGLISDGLIVW